MRSVNEVILIWWVANDPILKENKNWQNLVVFNLGTRRVWVTKEQERKEEVQYHKIAAWWRLAEKSSKLLDKWAKVYVRWYLHNRKVHIEWEEKPRIITEVVVNDLLVLSKKRKPTDEEDQNTESGEGDKNSSQEESDSNEEES